MHNSRIASPSAQCASAFPPLSFAAATKFVMVRKCGVRRSDNASLAGMWRQDLTETVVHPITLIYSPDHRKDAFSSTGLNEIRFTLSRV